MKKLSLQGWRARPKNTISIFPSVYTVAYAAGLSCLKKYGARLKSIVYVIGERDLDILMETKADYRHFSGFLVSKFKKRPDYLDNLIDWSEKNINLLHDYLAKKFPPDLISLLSNEALARRYLAYVKKYLAYHLNNTPAWWIGALAAEAELKRYLTANYREDSDSLLAVIIDPLEYYSENFKEEMSLLNIAVKVKKSKYLSLPPDSLSAAISRSLDKHCELYSSIPFGYKTGITWTKKDFWERVLILAKGDPAKVKKNKLAARRQKIITRNKTMRSLNLPIAYNNLVLALRKLSYLQELKKAAQTRSHPILQRTVFSEIAKRLDISVKYVEYLSEQEIASFLRGSVSRKFKDNLASRTSQSVLLIRDMKYTWLVGEKAKKFIEFNSILIDLEDIKEIRGQIASKGLARGRVKICLYSTEIGKVKDGDILVTAMTTPDFVPAMRKAGAIITDEGGITSHAAIIARELNKPCLIGAKIAVKALRDGQLIEVDANRGLIKILEK